MVTGPDSPEVFVHRLIFQLETALSFKSYHISQSIGLQTFFNVLPVKGPMRVFYRLVSQSSGCVGFCCVGHLALLCNAKRSRPHQTCLSVSARVQAATRASGRSPRSCLTPASTRRSTLVPATTTKTLWPPSTSASTKYCRVSTVSCILNTKCTIS